MDDPFLAAYLIYDKQRATARPEPSRRAWYRSFLPTAGRHSAAYGAATSKGLRLTGAGE